jgi:hypothetical protein
MRWLFVLGVGFVACSDGGDVGPVGVCPNDSGGRMSCVDAGAADVPADTATPTDTATEDRPTPADAPPATPACVQTLITTAASQPVGNPPHSIYRCMYRGATVYYLPPQCCDQFSSLISSDCELICSPDGGFTGGGDGRCTDFTRASCTLLWQDDRTR